MDLIIFFNYNERGKKKPLKLCQEMVLLKEWESYLPKTWIKAETKKNEIFPGWWWRTFRYTAVAIIIALTSDNKSVSASCRFSRSRELICFEFCVCVFVLFVFFFLKCFPCISGHEVSWHIWSPPCVALEGKSCLFQKIAMLIMLSRWICVRWQKKKRKKKKEICPVPPCSVYPAIHRIL